jgi:FixJ family two-component response regulator
MNAEYRTKTGHLAVHIVDCDSRARAEHARIVLMLGHHAEVYSSIDELLERSPGAGVLLVCQKALGKADELFERLSEARARFPLIVAGATPSAEDVVEAIKSGALDYLDLPIEPGRLARSFSRVVDEASAHNRARHQMVRARRRIEALSRRERQVLEWLALGCSNKVIARELGISPRTVEIHRANMMIKIGARHAAEAIRLWLQANLENPDQLREVVGARSIGDKCKQRPRLPIRQRRHYDEHQQHEL